MMDLVVGTIYGVAKGVSAVVPVSEEERRALNAGIDATMAGVAAATGAVGTAVAAGVSAATTAGKGAAEAAGIDTQHAAIRGLDLAAQSTSTVFSGGTSAIGVSLQSAMQGGLQAASGAASLVAEEVGADELAAGIGGVGSMVDLDAKKLAFKSTGSVIGAATGAAIEQSSNPDATALSSVYGAVSGARAGSALGAGAASVGAVKGVDAGHEAPPAAAEAEGSGGPARTAVSSEDDAALRELARSEARSYGDFSKAEKVEAKVYEDNAAKLREGGKVLHFGAEKLLVAAADLGLDVGVAVATHALANASGRQTAMESFGAVQGLGLASGFEQTASAMGGADGDGALLEATTRRGVAQMNQLAQAAARVSGSMDRAEAKELQDELEELRRMYEQTEDPALRARMDELEERLGVKREDARQARDFAGYRHVDGLVTGAATRDRDPLADEPQPR